MTAKSKRRKISDKERLDFLSVEGKVSRWSQSGKWCIERAWPPYSRGESMNLRTAIDKAIRQWDAAMLRERAR